MLVAACTDTIGLRAPVHSTMLTNRGPVSEARQASGVDTSTVQEAPCARSPGRTPDAAAAKFPETRARNNMIATPLRWSFLLLLLHTHTTPAVMVKGAEGWLKCLCNDLRSIILATQRDRRMLPCPGLLSCVSAARLIQESLHAKQFTPAVWTFERTYCWLKRPEAGVASAGAICVAPKPIVMPFTHASSLQTMMDNWHPTALPQGLHWECLIGH